MSKTIRKFYEEARDITTQQMLDRYKRREEEMVGGLFNRRYKEEIANACLRVLDPLSKEIAGRSIVEGALIVEDIKMSSLHLYTKLSEVFGHGVREEQKLLERIAIISHEGGLENLSESDALMGIRKLVLPYWQNGEKRRNGV